MWDMWYILVAMPGKHRQTMESEPSISPPSVSTSSFFLWSLPNQSFLYITFYLLFSHSEYVHMHVYVCSCRLHTHVHIHAHVSVYMYRTMINLRYCYSGMVYLDFLIQDLLKGLELNN